ncbi:ABC transporter, atp-binding protein [gamma proteobacterium HdN1]|nr:ABC transporter, atp-binding protein [gamma proteobacterium HdN1]
MLTIENMEIVRAGFQGKSQTGEAGYRVLLPQLKLAAGEVVAITGPSGCGKSTLLEAVGLILAPKRVQKFCLAAADRLDIQALLDANDEAKLSQIRAEYLGFVLQTGGLLPFLNVSDNIALTQKLSGRQLAKQWLDEAVGCLGITHLQKKMPSQLSIGERQRVAFVRAIAHQPSLLLADEPTAALDPMQARKLFALMVELVKQFQIAALVVTHDWELVRECGIRNILGRPAQNAAECVFDERD